MSLVVLGLSAVQGFSPTAVTTCTIPDKVTFATEENWPNWSLCSGDECSGLGVDVMNMVCEAAGLHCDYVSVPWPAVWGNGMKGPGFGKDFHVSNAARITAERVGACMHYSNPYTRATDGKLMATSAWAAKWNEMGGGDVKACAVFGYAMGKNQLEAMKADSPWNIMIDDSHPDADAAEAAALSGVCDVVLFDGTYSSPALSLITTVPAATPDSNLGAAFMMDGTDPNTPCLMDKLNMGVATIRENGKLQQAIDKHAPKVDAVGERYYSHKNEQCSM